MNLQIQHQVIILNGQPNIMLNYKYGVHMNNNLPEELLDIIDKLIIYEDKDKKNQIDNFQYEYAYDYVNDIYIEKDDANDSPTIIEISL